MKVFGNMFADAKTSVPYQKIKQDSRLRAVILLQAVNLCHYIDIYLRKLINIY